MPAEVLLAGWQTGWQTGRLYSLTYEGDAEADAVEGSVSTVGSKLGCSSGRPAQEAGEGTPEVSGQAGRRRAWQTFDAVCRHASGQARLCVCWTHWSQQAQQAAGQARQHPPSMRSYAACACCSAPS